MSEMLCFDPIGTGTGIFGAGKIAGALPETLVSSVVIIDETEEGSFRVRWTFDNSVDVSGADGAKFLLDGGAPQDTFAEINADNVVIQYGSGSAGAAAYELDAGHGVASPGRTVPGDQTGSVADGKILVTAVTRVDATHADWTFDAAVTVTDNVIQLLINGSSPVATAQQAANVLRCTYGEVSLSDAWEIISKPTNVTLGADRYVLFPQVGTVA